MLQKHQEHLTKLHSTVFDKRRVEATKFERDHRSTIRNFNFMQGALVLIQNTAIKKALNHKMHARYLGPLIVLSCNRGGMYIVCKLDGSIMDHPVMAFRVIPYHVRSVITLLPLDTLIDITTDHLCELEVTMLNNVEEVFAAYEK